MNNKKEKSITRLGLESITRLKNYPKRKS